MGGVPKPLVRTAFQLSPFDKLVTKPFVQLAKLDDTDFLAQVEAVDRFTDNMIAYPGRTFGQLYHRMIRGNELASGTVHFEGRDISFADITVPVLSFGGANDTIAPVSCVRPIEKLVPNAAFEVVPGGHLGMLTGRAARGTTWRILDEFIDEHTSDAGRPTKRDGGRGDQGGASGAKERSPLHRAKRTAASHRRACGPAQRAGRADPRREPEASVHARPAHGTCRPAKPRGRDAG